MKLPSLLILFFLVTAINVPGQVKFSTLSIDDAARQAKAENKIILLMVESPDCNNCNALTTRALSGWQCKKALETSCILLKMNTLPERFTNPSNVYLLNNQFFGMLFLDANLDILHTPINGSTSSSDFYAEQIDKALQQKNSNGSTLATLKKAYYGSNPDFNTIRLLIEGIRKLNMEPSEGLLDDLAQRAPADSFSSVSFLQFVMRCAPMVNSFAQQSLNKLNKNIDNYNMAWYRMNPPERSAINNRILNKSMAKAIAEKDQSYAFRVASFSQEITRSHPENMQAMYQSALLRYYKGIKDTVNYMRTAIPHFDQLFSKANLYEIKDADSLAKMKLFKGMPSASNQDIANPFHSAQIVVSNRQMSPQGTYYASALNDGAWSVYLFSKDPVQLAKALSWAKRANELTESPEVMDTYGRLLYKTGNKEEAINWETKADALARTKYAIPSQYEKVVEKMKAGATVIDP